MSTDTPFLRIEGVVRRFANVAAVDGVSLDVSRGELFALLGGSGSGKTTLLRILAGFERPDSGRVLIDGEDVTDTPPWARPVNMMFQSYALFPHMTVERNIAYGLQREGLPKGEIASRVLDALAMVELAELGGRKPHQLSGGQRQRVALARALVKRPKLLLLDEPLSALDRKLRERTQFELMGLQRKLGITFVMVTHDQEEAMTMASRIAVMDRGRLAQVASPATLYGTPASRFVADFIGRSTIVEGICLATSGDAVVVRCPTLGIDATARSDTPPEVGRPVWIAVRPENVTLGVERLATAANAVAGVVSDIAYLGGSTTLHVIVDAGATLLGSMEGAPRIGRGARVWAHWPADGGALLTK